MGIQFKFHVGQIVLYKNKQYTVLSRSYVETEHARMIRYNLGSPDIFNTKGYEANVWEEDISAFTIIE